MVTRVDEGISAGFMRVGTVSQVIGQMTVRQDGSAHVSQSPVASDYLNTCGINDDDYDEYASS